MAHVILINPFEIPKGKEEETLELWDRAADYLRQQPGFIKTRLHRAISPDARFYYVNVAEWKSEEQFYAAVSSEKFKELTKDAVSHYPALYEIVRE